MKEGIKNVQNENYAADDGEGDIVGRGELDVISY